jgi:hypothetical protein
MRASPLARRGCTTVDGAAEHERLELRQITHRIGRDAVPLERRLRPGQPEQRDRKPRIDCHSGDTVVNQAMLGAATRDYQTLGVEPRAKRVSDARRQLPGVADRHEALGLNEEAVLRGKRRRRCTAAAQAQERGGEQYVFHERPSIGANVRRRGALSVINRRRRRPLRGIPEHEHREG